MRPKTRLPKKEYVNPNVHLENYKKISPENLKVLHLEIPNVVMNVDLEGLYEAEKGKALKRASDAYDEALESNTRKPTEKEKEINEAVIKLGLSNSTSGREAGSPMTELESLIECLNNWLSSSIEDIVPLIEKVIKLGKG